MEDTDRRAEIRHYPMRLLKAIQARKQSRRGEVKQRRQIQSQQQRRKGRTIHLAEERRAARRAKQRNKQVTKQE